MIKGCLSSFFPPEIFTHFTPRSIDFSWGQGAKSPFREKHNNYLKEQLGLNPERVMSILQIHSDQVLCVSNAHTLTAQADALLTNIPGIALSIRTADCLPVFLYDPGQKCIGLAHAGWKGTRLGIVGQVVKKMHDCYGSDPEGILAGLGPAMRSCCYEVGPEFQGFFPAAVSRREGKVFFDLISENHSQLLAAGLMEAHIVDSKACTACSQNLFSFRREGASAGRHLSLMMLKFENG